MSLDDYSIVPDPYARHEYRKSVNGSSELWGVSIDGILYLRRTARDAYFRTKRGYSSSLEVLRGAKQHAVKIVQITIEHTDGRSTYVISTTLEHWLDKGIGWVDRSKGLNDLQLVLPLSEFTTEDGGPIDEYEAMTSPEEEEQYHKKYGKRIATT